MIGVSANLILLAIAVAGFALMWFLWELVRRLSGGRSNADGASRPTGSAGGPDLHMCPNPQCREINVTGARYCPRCGHEMHS